MAKETRIRLLEVARNLLDRGGAGSVTMRAVGRLAGLSRSALYRHFDNKESLLAAIVLDDFISLNKLLNGLEKEPVPPAALLRQMLISYYEFSMKNPRRYELMFNRTWDPGKYPDIKKYASMIFDKASQIIASIHKTHHPVNDNSIESTAIIYAFIHGLVSLHLSEHREASKGLNAAAVLIERMVELLLSPAG